MKWSPTLKHYYKTYINILSKFTQIQLFEKERSTILGLHLDSEKVFISDDNEWGKTEGRDHCSRNFRTVFVPLVFLNIVFVSAV